METQGADGNQVSNPTAPPSGAPSGIREVMAARAAAAAAKEDASGSGDAQASQEQRDQETVPPTQNPPDPKTTEGGDGEGTPAESEAKPADVDGEGGQTKTTEENHPGGEGGQSGEEDGDVITNFSQLIEHQEWDPEWADSLVLDVKIDGETRQVTIGDLKKTHQTFEAAEKRLTDAKEKAQSVGQELHKQREGMAVEIAGAATLVQLAEGLLNQDRERLAELKDTDRQAYLILKDEIAERAAQVNQVKGLAQKSMRELLATISTNGQMTEEERTDRAREENTKLLEKIPEWAGEENRERATKESAELVNHAISYYGFSEDEIKNVLDHRMFHMARDAMLYRRQQGASEAARKRVQKIPKVMKAGGEKPPAKPSRSRAEILYPKK